MRSKKNIFEGLSREHLIFKDERSLYPEFVPDKLFHRDREIEAIALALNPLLKGKKPHNVFLTGSTGVGKTTVSKYVLAELTEFSDRVKSLYINCFEFNSRHAVLSSITNFLGRASPRRGIATDEIYGSLLEAARKATFSPVIILDEVDQLFLNSDGQKLLYDLLRIVEFENKVFGIVLISNNEGLMMSLDERIKSSLAEEKIMFEPYSPSELKDILSERAELAFLPSVLDAEVIPFVAARCAKLGGDCRVGIEALLKGGRVAEKANAKSVQLSHVKNAFESVEGVSLLKGVKYLSAPEKTLLSFLAQNPQLMSGKLFELFSKSSKQMLSERRIRDILNGLEKKGFVVSEQVSMGNQGKTRSFKCRLPSGLLSKELGKI